MRTSLAAHRAQRPHSRRHLHSLRREPAVQQRLLRRCVRPGSHPATHPPVPRAASAPGWMKRRCLDCGAFSSRSRCPQCTAVRRRPRDRQNNAARGGSGWTWQRTRKAVLERDGHRCLACGATGVRFEVDHIVPLAAGGSNEPANLRTMCVLCHRARTTTRLDSSNVPHVNCLSEPRSR